MTAYDQALKLTKTIEKSSGSLWSKLDIYLDDVMFDNSGDAAIEVIAKLKGCEQTLIEIHKILKG